MAAPKTTQFSAAFPSAPLLDDATGLLTPAWRGFFRALWARTGDAGGVDLNAVVQSLTEIDNGLSVRDDELAAGIVAETNARRVADSTEATARATADATKVSKSGDTMTGGLIAPSGVFTELAAEVANFGIVGVGADPATSTVWTSAPGPPGTFVAPLGSLYSDTSGAVGATLYVSRGGGTWLPVAGV